MSVDSGVLWTEYGDRLRAFVGRRLRHPADVDDVVQDLFLRLHLALSTGAEPDRLVPWLFGIARRSIADHLRARPRPDPPGPNPESPGPEAELAGCVRSMTADLPNKDRVVLSLTTLEGHDDRQVAARLQLSLAAAKSRLRRARARLRRRLEACCRIELDTRRRVMAWSPRGHSCSQICA